MGNPDFEFWLHPQALCDPKGKTQPLWAPVSPSMDEDVKASLVVKDQLSSQMQSFGIEPGPEQTDVAAAVVPIKLSWNNCMEMAEDYGGQQLQ